MKIDHLITMANQIGGFFDAMPDHDEAVADVAQHIKRFWEPRMRRAFLGHVDSHAGEGLAPIVLEAVGRHRSLFE